MQDEIASGHAKPRFRTAAEPIPWARASSRLSRCHETDHRPDRPPEDRSKVTAHTGALADGAASTRQRLLAADGGIRLLSCMMRSPIPPPASAASCSRREAIKSGGAPGRIRAAPLALVERSASSNAQRPSWALLAPTSIRLEGERPKPARPAGQTSGSVPIQTTDPAERARTKAQKPIAAPAFASRTSWNAARARPALGRWRLIGVQSGMAPPWTGDPCPSMRATAARSASKVSDMPSA